MDKLIKYRKKFVQFCFENGYDINKIRSSKAVTVYECTPTEAHKYGTPFIIEVKDDTDIIHRLSSNKPAEDSEWLYSDPMAFSIKQI